MSAKHNSIMKLKILAFRCPQGPVPHRLQLSAFEPSPSLVLAEVLYQVRGKYVNITTNGT